MEFKELPCCGLCRQSVSTLRDSHLLPKSLYRILKKQSDDNSDIFFSPRKGKWNKTDRQIHKRFLCPSCEDLFSKKGETVVVKECLRDKSFLIREKLSTIQPLQRYKNEPELFEAKHIDTAEYYLYFALSVFWRASVTKWGKYCGYREALGDNYSENVRLYLLTEEKKYLKDMFLFVNVNFDNSPIGACSFPIYDKRGDCHFHQFYIPGVYFKLIVSKKTSKLLEAQQHLIFVKFHFSKTKEFEYLQDSAQSFWDNQ